MRLTWQMTCRRVGRLERIMCFLCRCRCCSVDVAPLHCEHQSRVLFARQWPPVRPAVSPTTVTRTQPKPTTRRSSRRCCLPGPSSSSGCRSWFSSFCRHMSTPNSQLTLSLPIPLRRYTAILVWPTIFNFWHSGTLALRTERQSARMSKVKIVG